MMKLVETKISDTAIYMRYADSLDSAKATRWIDFQVPIATLTEGMGQNKTPLDHLEIRHLGVIQKAALLRVRALIEEENQALGARLSP